MIQIYFSLNDFLYKNSALLFFYKLLYLLGFFSCVKFFSVNIIPVRSNFRIFFTSRIVMVKASFQIFSMTDIKLIN